MTEQRIVRFGVFEADLASGELRKSGLKIKLRDQPFQILAMPLERPGEVVTREELQQRLWPEDTFVDFDHSLNAAINRLRDALGDAAGSARFIETVPRRGYRFIAPVEPVEGTAPAPVPAPPPAFRAHWPWVAALALMSVAGGTALWWRDAEPAPLTAIPITSDPEQEREPALSPDANYVAYVRVATAGGGTGDIFVKQIGSERVIQLTSGPRWERNPSWSPDGRSIAFVREYTDNRAGIVVVPALGGTERQVAMIMGYAQLDLGMGRIAWHPDGRHLLVSRAPEGQPSGYAVSILSLEDGAVRAISSPPPGIIGDVSPAISRDGRNIAFARATYVGLSEIYVQGLTSDNQPSGQPRRLTFDNVQNLEPVWTPDGRDIVFVSGTQHRRSLWRVASGGGRPRRLALPGGERLDGPSFAFAKPAMVYRSAELDVNIWRTTLGGGAPKQEALLASTHLDHMPAYSPAGERIAWVSDRGGFPEIWISDANGRSPFCLTSLKSPMAGFPKWSPDGNRLVFRASHDIYVVEVKSGAVRRLTVHPATDNSPSWSPDGKWIYFSSTRSGRTEVWRLAIDSPGEPAQVTKQGGTVPFPDAGGRTVFYSSRDGTELWSVPAEGGEEKRILTGLSNTGNFVVRPEGIYFIPAAKPSGESSIDLLELDSGVRRTIAPVGRSPMWGLAVSPDGKSILHTQLDRHSGDLMMAENFH